MVFTSLNPARETYTLWLRFRMPTQHGSRDAVAVEVKVGNQLISAYTFMLEHIVLLAWSIVVLLGLLVSIKKYAHDHPSRPLSMEIWRKRASPFEILKLAFRHFRKERSARWLIVPWLAIAVAFVVVKYTVPIIFAPYIQIGSAAPVRPDAIFVPSRNGTGGDITDEASDLLTMEIFEFQVPSALRAAGSVESVMNNKKTNGSVLVRQPEILQVVDDEQVIRIGYEYNVTGLDLGLQNHPDLTLNVEGSCITDYSWWSFSDFNNPAFPGAFIDVYNVFGDPGNTQAVSKYDGGPALAYFFANPPTDTPTNATWSAIVSSVNRTSYWNSTDPWYRTGRNPLLDEDPQTAGLAPLMVMPQRPALSCWQNDVWSYRGNTGDISHLDAIPGLELPLGIRTILVDALGAPMIFSLGSSLRASSLKSSSTADSDLFDANSSSIFNDLQRLVFASYIATVNTLTETTLYSPHEDFLNDVTYNNALLDGTADFVIFSNDVVTLSVRSLIIIPTLAVTLWVIFLVLMFLPIPGKLVADLSSSRKTNGNLEEHESKQPQQEKLRDQDALASNHPQSLAPAVESSHKPEPSVQPKPEIAEPEEESKAEKVLEQAADTIQQVLSSDSESEIESMIP